MLKLEQGCAALQEEHETRCDFHRIESSLSTEVVSLSIGHVLILGILLSYSPQIIRIIVKRTNVGVSYITMWLATIGAWLTFVNVLLLDWPCLACTSTWSAGRSYIALLPLFQLTVGPVCLFVLYIVIVAYFHFGDQGPAPDNVRMRHRAAAWALLFVGLVLITGLVGMAIAASYGDGWASFDRCARVYCAKLIGLVASVVIGIVWLPQIYTTFRARSTGALSIEMLLLQAPGSLVVIVFQFISLNTDVTTWLPYLVTAIEQVILIVMWFVFYTKERALRWNNRRKESAASSLVDEDTETPVPQEISLGDLSPSL